MPDNKLRVIPVHRQRATDDDLAGQVARLLQRVVHPIPMHSKEKSIRLVCGNGRCTRGRIIPRFLRKAFQLGLAARVAEDHAVASAGEDGPELSTHQTGTEDPDSHCMPRVTCYPIVPPRTARAPKVGRRRLIASIPRFVKASASGEPMDR